MTATDSKRWMHPQAVPRGFLRLYLLSLVSRRPETGYSMMQTIDEKTDGAWRPGPGTVYPLLRSLVKEGLVKQVDSGERQGSIAYTVTDKGKQELEQMQHALSSAGRKQRVMMRLFADLLPAAVVAPFLVSRYREMFEVFREKLGQIPQPERDSILKEMLTVTETQLGWVESQLAPKAKRISR